MHHVHTRQSSAASEIEVCSIYATTQEIRAAAAKQADTCVARVAWCGVWRVEGSPRTAAFVEGHRLELQYGGPLIG